MPGTIVVRPDNPANTHDLSFEINGIEYGVKLKRGAKSVNEIPATPSNILVKQTGKRFGDFDPANTHIEMRDWSGGRAGRFLVDDPSKFFDSQDLWTLTPGVVHQAPQWSISSGNRAGQEQFLPGSVRWRPLLADDRSIAVNYRANASYSIDRIQMWIRRVGNPSSLTFRHIDDLASSIPSTVGADINANIIITTGTILDTVSKFQDFTFTTAFSQVSGSSYHITLSATTADNYANHWEVGYSNNTNTTWEGSNTITGHATSDMSSDAGSQTWTTEAWVPYFRVVPASTSQKYTFFTMGQSGILDNTYAISRNRDSTNQSFLYRLSTVSPRTQWTTADWDNEGAGGTTISGVVDDFAVMSSIVVFARGDGNNLFMMRQTSTSPEVEGSTAGEAVKAHRLGIYHHPTDGRLIYRVSSGFFDVSHSTFVAFGTTFTFKPSTGIPVGDGQYAAVDLQSYDDKMYVRTLNQLWVIKDDRGIRLPIGIDNYIEETLFPQMQDHDLFLFFGWDYSVERLYGKTINDVGLWRNEGLPTSRSGPAGAFESIIGNLFMGVDAGTTGISGVFAWNARGWHETFRAPSTALQIQGMMYQPMPSTNPRLWMSVGDDIYYQDFPRHTLNPLRDPNMSFQHESVLITPTIDMGVSQIPKLFSEVHVISKNLNSTGTEIRMDYQIDEEVGGSTWIHLGTMIRSPSDSLTINRGDVKQLRLRLRMYTANVNTATEVYAIIVKGVARTPVKRQWNIRATIGDFQVNSQGMDDVDPDAFYEWIYSAAESLHPIYMRSRWHNMNGLYVYAEPPSVSRTYTTPSGEWGAELNLVLRER